MICKPILRISPSDLDNLMTTLEVGFVKLAECLVSPGWRLLLSASDMPCMHYVLAGSGHIIIGEEAPVALAPHTLVIIPPRHSFSIEVASRQGNGAVLLTSDGRGRGFGPDALRKFIAGDGSPQLILICGHFRACYGTSIDLFAALSSPIVEQFAAADRMGQKLSAALNELAAQEIGAGTMSKALLKQMLVILLRRSLTSVNLWVERFAILNDPHIARAFADMVARPSAPHTVQSLAQCACLSRSAFMARFTGLIGRAPMIALRELRMRQAALLLATDGASIAQIALLAGYASRSSFQRAFRKVYGADPLDYRAVARQQPSWQRAHVGGGEVAGMPD